MKDFIIAGLFVLSGTSFAGVTCTAVQDSESVEVKIIDTFIERSAFIKRLHPTLTFPVEEIGVEITEQSGTIIFENQKKGFHLEIDKENFERSLPVAYKGQLSFGHFFTEISCVLE